MSLLKLISAVILSAAVCACSPAPRINAQSEASAKASILKLTEKMTPEERVWAEEKLGLKDPISVQYIRWAGNALQGDFGIS